MDTDSGTVIRDVYLGTDRLTEGVLGIRRTAPKVSVHMSAKGTLGIRSVAPDHWSRFSLIRTGGGTLAQLYSHRYGAKLYLSRRDGHKGRLKGTGSLACSV